MVLDDNSVFIFDDKIRLSTLECVSLIIMAQTAVT